MPRVDVWDIPEDKPSEPIWIGYRQGLTDKYDLGKKLGEGGFGSVRMVVLKSNGAEFACKSICKRLDVPNLPPIKQQQHLENIKREVSCSSGSWSSDSSHEGHGGLAWRHSQLLYQAS